MSKLYDAAAHAIVVLAIDDSPSQYNGMSEKTRTEFLEEVWGLVRIWGCAYETAKVLVQNIERAKEWTERGRIIPEVE